MGIHGALGWASLQPITGQPVTGQPVMGQPVMGQPVMGQPWNFFITCATIGLFLGWQAVLGVVAISGLLCLTIRLMLRQNSARKNYVMLPVVLVATFAYLMFWNEMALLTSWP